MNGNTFKCRAKKLSISKIKKKLSSEECCIYRDTENSLAQANITDWSDLKMWFLHGLFRTYLVE